MTTMDVKRYTWRDPNLFTGATPPKAQVEALERLTERLADEDDFARGSELKRDIEGMFRQAGIDPSTAPELVDRVNEIRQGLHASEGRYENRPEAKDAIYGVLRGAALEQATAAMPEASRLFSGFLPAPLLPAARADGVEWARPEPAVRPDPKPDTSTVRGAARYLLDSDNVSFWSDLSTGSDRRALEQIARTGRSDVPFTGGNVEPNADMMRALAEMAEKGPIQITALTGGEHSVGSNHYDGNAVDLSIYTGDAAEIESVANRHGGTRNFETDHIHLDFVG